MLIYVKPMDMLLEEKQENHTGILIYSSNTTYMHIFTSLPYHAYIIGHKAFQIVEYN